MTREEVDEDTQEVAIKNPACSGPPRAVCHGGATCSSQRHHMVS